MAIIIMERMVSHFWTFEPGEYIDWLDPIREANWVNAGYALYCDDTSEEHIEAKGAATVDQLNAANHDHWRPPVL